MTHSKFYFLALVITILASCKSGQPSVASAPQAGMFKVTIFYPNGEGKTFDMDYYQKKHMPMVAGYLGSNLQGYEIVEGISGRTPEDELPFLAMGSFHISNLDLYNKAIAANRDAIIGDFKNYTNVMPLIQISEVKFHGK